MSLDLMQGGQGTVYLADVLSADRGRFPVAAKVPSAGLPGNYLLEEVKGSPFFLVITTLASVAFESLGFFSF